MLKGSFSQGFKSIYFSWVNVKKINLKILFCFLFLIDVLFESSGKHITWYWAVEKYFNIFFSPDVQIGGSRNLMCNWRYFSYVVKYFIFIIRKHWISKSVRRPIFDWCLKCSVSRTRNVLGPTCLFSFVSMSYKQFDGTLAVSLWLNIETK